MLPDIWTSNKSLSEDKSESSQTSVKWVFIICPWGDCRGMINGEFNLADSCYSSWEELCKLQGEKGKHQVSSFLYDNYLLTRHTGAIVAQVLWEWPTTFWLDLRAAPWDGTHAWQCWHGHKSYTAQVTGLEENQILFLSFKGTSHTHKNESWHSAVLIDQFLPQNHRRNSILQPVGTNTRAPVR